MRLGIIERLCVLAGTTGALLLVPGTASAVSCPGAPGESCLCVTTPVTVPGLSGAPEWKEMTGDGFFRPELHDPRWSGSPLRFLGASSEGALDAMEVTWRAVRHGNYLYLAIETQGTDDAWPSIPLDEVQIGLTEGASSTAYAINIRLQKGAAIVPPAGVPSDAAFDVDPVYGSYWESNVSGSFAASTEQTGLPAWVQHTTIFEFPTSGVHRWGLATRIDLSAAGANAMTGDLRLFVAARVVKSLSDVTFANVPPVAVQLNGVGGTSNIPPATSSWLRVAEIGTTCTDGISVTSSDLGILPAAPGASIATPLTSNACASDPCPPQTPAGNPENVFRVTARGVLPGGDWRVRPRFRIADWGSTIADRKNAPWKDVGDPAGIAVFDAPVGTFTASGSGWAWQEVAASGKFDATIDFQCDKGAEAYCPLLSTPVPTQPASNHQCLLVELGLPMGSTDEINTPAVYRNLNFYSLSELKENARIDLKGLASASGKAQDRDVYLYVETLNMPAHGEKPLWLPAEDMARAAELAKNPPRIPRAEGPEADLQNKLAAKHLSREAAAQRLDQIKRELARLGRLVAGKAQLAGVPASSLVSMSPEQILESVWPTFKIWPYIDTGETNTKGGKTTKVMAPMVPFGYHLSHDGAFYGFEHELSAGDPTVQITKLSDRWYKLRIKSEGSALVTTRVEAAETPIGGPSVCQDCEKALAEARRELEQCRADKKGRCGCRYPGERPGTGTGLLLMTLLGGLWYARRRWGILRRS